jgi:hypothetical protein
MNKEFVPPKQSLELKELGFDEPCLGFYYKLNDDLLLEIPVISYKENKNSIIDETFDNKSECITAPLYQQAFSFFREKYNLYAELYTANMGAIEYCFQIRDLYSEKYIYDNFQGAGSSYVGTFNTPEEAELACLVKLISIVKEQQNETI